MLIAQQPSREGWGLLSQMCFFCPNLFFRDWGFLLLLIQTTIVYAISGDFMKRRYLSFSVVLVAQLFVTLSFSQAVSQEATHPDSTRVYRFPEVTITATRSERDVASVGRSVTIITNNEIKNSPCNSVAELLSQQEGIYINGTTQTPGSFQNIYLRGANANQTVIMIDGIRITDPSSTDNAIDLSELSLANVQRIEIVRGSHSTMFGSSAIGGVINILTQNNSAEGLHTDTKITMGTFGKNTSDLTENLSLHYAFGNGMYLNGTIYNTNVNGNNATVDTVTNPNTYNRPDQDGFRKTDIVGRIGYKDERADISISYKSTNQKSDIDAGAYQDDNNYTIDFNRSLLIGNASYKLNDNLGFIYLTGVTHSKRFSRNDSSVVDNAGTTDHSYFEGTYEGDVFNNELQSNIRLKGLQLVLGGGLYKEKMDIHTYYLNTAFSFESRTDLASADPQTTLKNLFLHADISGLLLSESLLPLSIGVGIRYNNHSTYGDNTTYEFNPSVRIAENTLLYGSYTTGFNAPSLYQLYSPEKDFGTGITRGNKNLQPETSRSYEIGIKQQVGERLSLTASYMNTVVENIIDYVYLWSQTKPVDSLTFLDYRGDTYLNLGRQLNKGVEFGMHSRISDKLMFSANISLTSGKLEYNPSNIDVNQTKGNRVQVFANGAFMNKQRESLGLVRRPNTANLALTYKPDENLTVKLDVRYVGPRTDVYYESSLGPFGALATVGVEDYTLLDVSGRYQITNSLSALIRIQNLLDTEYSEIKGYTTLGRSVFLSIRHTL